MCKKGVFITFEGGDGAGKSTHIQLLKKELEQQGRSVLIIREPGGTQIGEKIREILLDPENSEMVSQAELLLYEASRAQIVAEKIVPALNKGYVVLADRFFDSSVAYQGYGRGLSISAIKAVNMFATNGLVPDRTILIQTESVENSLHRATVLSGADRIESAGFDFHKKVSDGFLQMAKSEPDRFKIVKLQKTIEQTFKLICFAIEDLI